MKPFLHIISVLTILVATTGCNREHVPDNLIDTATMTAILTEYYLIDGYDYMVASRHKDSLGFQSHAAKEALLEKYNVTQADIDSSLAYYGRHQKVFETIMNRAISALDNSTPPLPSGNVD